MSKILTRYMYFKNIFAHLVFVSLCFSLIYRNPHCMVYNLWIWKK